MIQRTGIATVEQSRVVEVKEPVVRHTLFTAMS